MAPERRVAATSLLEKIRRNAVSVKFCFIAPDLQGGGAGSRLGDSIRVEEVGGAELAEFIQGRLPGGRDGLRFFAFLDRLQDRA